MTTPPTGAEPKEFSPRQMAFAAINDYFAICDLDSHGVSHIFIEFPSMYYAAAWARFFGIESSVRYFAPESNTDRYLSMSVRVIFEF